MKRLFVLWNKLWTSVAKRKEEKRIDPIEPLDWDEIAKGYY